MTASVISMYGCDTSSPSTTKLHRRPGVRGRHQQPAEKLARDIACHRGPAAGQAVGANRHRRTTAAPLGNGIGPELPQRIEQVLDRAFAHAGRAVEAKRAVPERQHGREKSHGRAAVGHVEVGGLQRATRPPQPDTWMVAAAGSCSTAMPSCRNAWIMTRVSSLSSAPTSVESPSAKAAQTKRPIGDALGAWRTDRPPQWARSVESRCCLSFRHYSVDGRRQNMSRSTMPLAGAVSFRRRPGMLGCLSVADLFVAQPPPAVSAGLRSRGRSALCQQKRCLRNRQLGSFMSDPDDQVFRVLPRQADETIAAALREWLPGKSWSEIRRLLQSRRVMLNGNLCDDPRRRLRLTGRCESAGRIRFPHRCASTTCGFGTSTRTSSCVEKPAGMTSTRHDDESKSPGRRRQLQPTLG